MTFISAKVSKATAYKADWFQVDVNSQVSGSPTEAILEVTCQGGTKLGFRKATGNIELTHEFSSGGAGITSTAQIVVPLASSRYFEYKVLEGNAVGLDISIVGYA